MASSFTIAGMVLTASLVAPVGLAMVTDRAWVAGLLLVGLGVLAAVAGLLGVYPHANATSPRLATVGVLSAAMAGLGALALLAMGGIALVGTDAIGIDLGTPMGMFAFVALSMAGGLSIGFLSFGTQVWRFEHPSRAAGWSLLLAGGLLLVAVVAELVRFAVGVGPTAWLVLLVVGLVSLDTLALGVTLRSDGD